MTIKIARFAHLKIDAERNDGPVLVINQPRYGKEYIRGSANCACLCAPFHQRMCILLILAAHGQLKKTNAHFGILLFSLLPFI